MAYFFISNTHKSLKQFADSSATRTLFAVFHGFTERTGLIFSGNRSVEIKPDVVFFLFMYLCIYYLLFDPSSREQAARRRYPCVITRENEKQRSPHGARVSFSDPKADPVMDIYTGQDDPPSPFHYPPILIPQMSQIYQHFLSK